MRSCRPAIAPVVEKQMKGQAHVRSYKNKQKSDVKCFAFCHTERNRTAGVKRGRGEGEFCCYGQSPDFAVQNCSLGLQDL